MSVYHVSKNGLFVMDDGAWGHSPACLTRREAVTLARVLKGIAVQTDNSGLHPIVSLHLLAQVTTR